MYLNSGTLRIYSWEVLSRKKQSSSEVRGRPIVSDSSSTLRSSAFWRRKGGKEGRTLASLPSAFFVILRYRLPTPRLPKQTKSKGREAKLLCVGGRDVGGHSAGVLLLRTRCAAASCPTSITHKKGGKKGNNTEKEDGGRGRKGGIWGTCRRSERGAEETGRMRHRRREGRTDGRTAQPSPPLRRTLIRPKPTSTLRETPPNPFSAIGSDAHTGSLRKAIGMRKG